MQRLRHRNQGRQRHLPPYSAENVINRFEREFGRLAPAMDLTLSFCSQTIQAIQSAEKSYAVSCAVAKTGAIVGFPEFRLLAQAASNRHREVAVPVSERIPYCIYANIH